MTDEERTETEESAAIGAAAGAAQHYIKARGEDESQEGEERGDQEA
jgi:hypothetical protein